MFYLKYIKIIFFIFLKLFLISHILKILKKILTFLKIFLKHKNKPSISEAPRLLLYEYISNHSLLEAWKIKSKIPVSLPQISHTFTSLYHWIISQHIKEKLVRTLSIYLRI